MIVGNLFKPYSLAGEFDRPRSKLIWPAIISGAAGLIGSLISNAGNNANNHTQIDLARENNAFNERMFDRQIAYNWDMFNAENEYNDAESQVKRYMEAGVNPALAMEGQSASTAQGGSVSPPSASSLPNTQSYDWSQSFSRIGDIIYNQVMREKELQLMDEQINKQHQENEFNKGYYDVQLRRAKWQAMHDYNTGLISMQEYKEMKETYDTRRAQMDEDVRLRRGQADYQQSVIAAQVLENKLKEFNLDKAPELFKAQMVLLGAQIQAQIASGKASIAQAEKAYAERAESIARAAGVNLSNKQARATFFSTVMATNAKNWSEAAGSRNEFQYQSDLYDMYNQTPGYTDKPIERRIRTATGGIVQPVRGIFR